MARPSASTVNFKRSTGVKVDAIGYPGRPRACRNLYVVPPTSPKRGPTISDAAHASPRDRTLTDVILDRRSARNGFADLPVDRSLLELVTRCGLAAPSSKSARPWRFHVVMSRELNATVADAMTSAEGAENYVPFDPLTGDIRRDWTSTVHESAELLAAAPVAVFIENRGSFSRGRTTLIEAIRDHRIGSLVAYTFEVVGVGAAIENMWLAAESLGLVATFMGDVVIAEAAVAQMLSIAGDLVGVLVLGHPLADESWTARAPESGADLVTWHDELGDPRSSDV
jgi:nitroreductase